MKITNNSKIQIVRLGLTLAALTLITSAFADTVVVTARLPNSTTPNSCPPFCEISASGTWSGSGSSSHSSAAGDTALGCVFAPGSVVGIPAVTITPTLGSLGVYSVEVTHIATSASANVIMSMSATGGTLTTNQTAGFQAANGANVWYTNGFITNTSLTPSITYTYVSGAQAASGSRIYADGFRFVLQGLLCQNVGQISVVNGPLANGQTFVNVPNVAATSTNVTVYSDTGSGSLTAIGSLAVTNATSAVVPVTALVKGTYISATQWLGGQESCQLAAGTGQLVGGGANTFLGVCLDMIEDSTLTGPIGAPASSTSTDLYFLGANGRTGGSATAPANPLILQPSTCWQTVYIDPTTANYYHWASSLIPNPDTNRFAELDAIAFAIEDTDTGPYDIYIDNFQNGPVTIYDFETPTNGTVGYGFDLPSFATTPSGYLLAPSPGSVSPNISVVSTNYSASGSNSLHVGWQFTSTANVDWLRLVAANHPMIDLTQPISFQILILPVGTTNTGARVAINTQPASTNVPPGQTATFNVVATGNSLTYQWLENGAIIPGANSSSYTTATLSTNDSGSIFQVQVTDSVLCPAYSTSATLSVGVAVVPTSILITPSPSGVVLNWTGSHTLQSATKVTGPWTAVSGPVLTGPYTNAYSGVEQFFRLQN